MKKVILALLAATTLAGAASAGSITVHSEVQGTIEALTGAPTVDGTQHVILHAFSGDHTFDYGPNGGGEVEIRVWAGTAPTSDRWVVGPNQHLRIDLAGPVWDVKSNTYFTQ